MNRIRLYLLGLVLLTALLPGCGLSEAQNRPAIVALYPPNDTLLTQPLAEIQITYDQEVTILNPFDIVITADGVLVPTAVRQRSGEPRVVYVRPTRGAFYPADTRLAIHVIQGAVINSERHYALDGQIFGLDTGAEGPVAVGRPGFVTLLDPFTFARVQNVPTPAGRDPVAIFSTSQGQDRRFWVQLDNGAGSGAALAWFSLGDAAMTPLSLTTSGGDLRATSPAITLAPDGRSIFAAYRDELSERIRICRVDVGSATETGSLELQSVPAAATTMPADLALEETGDHLLVPSHDAATGTLAYVDRASFSEVDRDPDMVGIQGVVLPVAAGPLVHSQGQSNIAPAGSADLTLVTTANDALRESPSAEIGSSVDISRTRDGIVLLQPLAGFADSLALQIRTTATGYLGPMGLELSDDIGGGSRGATDAVALAWYSGSNRFMLMLDTPLGRIMTVWDYTGIVFQLDLNENVDGVQAIDIESVAPGATTIGRFFGDTVP